MKTRHAAILTALCVSGTAALAGCNGAGLEGASNGTGAGDVGSVALALQAAPGITVNTFSYSLTGPTSRTGSINVANSTTVSTLLSAISAGAGYAVSLTGTATDGTTTCSGASGTFSVSAATTTPVTVAITCKRVSTNGSILITGTINVCPQVDAVSATPPTGNVIAISSTSDDPDAGPQPIAYHWM